MAAVNDGSCSHRVVPSQEKISRRRFNIICSPAKAIATTAVAQIVHFAGQQQHVPVLGIVFGMKNIGT